VQRSASNQRKRKHTREQRKYREKREYEREQRKHREGT
jgi:hypothetical protein